MAGFLWFLKMNKYSIECIHPTFVTHSPTPGRQRPSPRVARCTSPSHGSQGRAHPPAGVHSSSRWEPGCSALQGPRHCVGAAVSSRLEGPVPTGHGPPPSIGWLRGVPGARPSPGQGQSGHWGQQLEGPSGLCPDNLPGVPKGCHPRGLGLHAPCPASSQAQLGVTPECGLPMGPPSPPGWWRASAPARSSSWWQSLGPGLPHKGEDQPPLPGQRPAPIISFGPLSIPQGCYAR